MYLQILIARTLIIPLIYSKFPFLLKFLQIKGKTCQMKVVLINFKLIYNSVDVEKKNSKQFVLFWCKLSKNLRQLTEAAYSSSSLANTASSSDFFSSVNQRLSATRGRRDGNVADEVAILDVLKFPRIYRWHRQALSLSYVKGFEKGRDFPECLLDHRLWTEFELGGTRSSSQWYQQFDKIEIFNILCDMFTPKNISSEGSAV